MIHIYIRYIREAGCIPESKQEAVTRNSSREKVREPDRVNVESMVYRLSILRCEGIYKIMI